MNQDVSAVGLDTRLVDLGMDSMGLTQLKGMIEATFGVEVEDELLFDEDTTITVIESAIGAAQAAGSGVVATADAVQEGDVSAQPRAQMEMEQRGDDAKTPAAAGGGGCCPCL